MTEVGEAMSSSIKTANTKNWYVVYTKPRWEKKVVQLLENAHVENYCPLKKSIRQWSDRKKVILEPIFKSYVFVKIEDEHKWKVKDILGVVNFIYWLGKPAIVREEEINSIKNFFQDHFPESSDSKITFTTNSKVKIIQGVFMNNEAIVVESMRKSSKVNIFIKRLGLTLTASFDNNNLIPITE